MNKSYFKDIKRLILGCNKSPFRALLLVCAVTVSIAAQNQDKAAQIDALMAEQNFDKKPGAAVLVIENGKTVYQKGFGAADLKTGRLIASDTAFDLASVTKQFTALAILQLAEKGKLSLNDSLRKFYPEFPPYADKITVRHLLNHTSGLPDYIELFLKSGMLKENGEPGGYEPTNDDVIKLIAEKKEPRFAAGEKWEYSNSGYAMLAKIVEKAAGKSFPQYVGENIFKPLKMTQTVVYNEKKPKISNRALSFRKKGDVYANVDYTPLNLIYGDGSINSTLEDLAKWNAALDTEKLIKAETLKQAFEPGKLNDGKPTNYGFGWFVKNTPYGLETSHSGGWAGFRTFIARYPEKRLSVVVLSNSAEFNPVQNGMKIARVFLDESNSPQNKNNAAAQNPIAEELVLVISKQERTLSFIDPVKLTEIAKIPVPGGPHELAVSADNRFAYVANYHQSDDTPGRSISVIDIAARKEIKKIELGGLMMPHGIVESGGKFYFTSEMTRTVGRYNTQTDSVDWIRGTGQSLTHIPAISPDGKRLYATNMFSDSVTMIEIEGAGQEPQTIKQIPVGNKPEGIAVSPDGKEIWVGHNGDGGVSIIDAASLTVKQTVKVGQVPIRLAFTRDGKRVVIADPKASEMLVYDASTKAEIKRIKIAGAPVGFALSSNEKRAFVSLVGAAKAALVDLETGETLGSVKTGVHPDGIVWLGARR